MCAEKDEVVKPEARSARLTLQSGDDPDGE
jgi:hypothetical protein